MKHQQWEDDRKTLLGEYHCQFLHYLQRNSCCKQQKNMTFSNSIQIYLQIRIYIYNVYYNEIVLIMNLYLMKYMSVHINIILKLYGSYLL